MENIVASSTVLGAIVGLILALTGAGGAILAVPLLLFVLHLSVAEAAPVALLAVGLSAAVGAVIGLRAGIVRYRAAMLMAVTGTVFSPAGLWLAHRLPNGPLRRQGERKECSQRWYGQDGTETANHHRNRDRPEPIQRSR